MLHKDDEVLISPKTSGSSSNIKNSQLELKSKLKIEEEEINSSKRSLKDIRSSSKKLNINRKI